MEFPDIDGGCERHTLVVRRVLLIRAIAALLRSSADRLRDVGLDEERVIGSGATNAGRACEDQQPGVSSPCRSRS